MFLYIYSCVKTRPQWSPNPTVGDHGLNKVKYTLPEYALTQFTAFLADWFLKRFLKICFYKFLPKNSIPNCGPTIPQEITVCKYLNLLYLRMFPYELQFVFEKFFFVRDTNKCVQNIILLQNLIHFHSPVLLR